MKRLSIILAIVLAIIVAGALYLINWLRQPVVTRVPVAIEYIPAGTPISDGQFRVAEMSNIDRQTLDSWVLADQFASARGRVLSSDVRAGFPIAKAQLDPNATGQDERRLSLAITGTNSFYVVLAVGPDQIGNFVQPDDHIDLIVSIGQVPNREFGVVITPTPPAGDTIGVRRNLTVTSQFPISKLTLQNLRILRVDRAPAPQQAQSATNNPQAQAPRVVQDVRRIYVEVDRDQLEVLSFVLNNGTRNYAIRAATGIATDAPTEGVVWEDFVRWFYIQRGLNPDPATPFDSVGPYSPTVKSLR